MKDVIYFNEWFENYCNENFPKKNITFNNFLENFRPENYNWTDDICYDFSDSHLNSKIAYRIKEKNGKISNCSFPDIFYQAFNWDARLRKLKCIKFYHIEHEWKKYLKENQDSIIIFSRYPILDYKIINEKSNKEINLKRRSL